MSEPHVETPATGPKENGQPSELDVLRQKLAEAERQRDEFRRLAQTVQADFENYQKRFQKGLAEERRYAQRPLAGDLLSALDNLERALNAARQNKEDGPLVQGVTMVQNQLLDVLRRHGVTRIEAQGQPFDANLHEAVMQQASAEHPSETVMAVLEPGYMLHDRVLRPARVMVSKKPD